MGFFSKLFRDRDPEQAEADAGPSAEEGTEHPTEDSAPAEVDASPATEEPSRAAAPARPRVDTVPAVEVGEPEPEPEPVAAAAAPPPPPIAAQASVSAEPWPTKRRTVKQAPPAVPGPVARGDTEPMSMPVTRRVEPPTPKPATGVPSIAPRADSAKIRIPPAGVPSVAARADSGRIPVPPPPRSTATKVSAPSPRAAAPAGADPARETGADPKKPASGDAPRRGRRDSTADLFAEIDTAIDGAQEAEGVMSREGVLETEGAAAEEMRRLFGEIAAQHAGHLRDFAIELSLSPTGKAWLSACVPAIEAIKGAAAKIQHHDLVAALGRFEAVLEQARSSPRTKIDGAPREAILAGYEDLRGILPSAFEVKEQRDRREPIVLSALIAQVPGITSLDIHRIHGAGAMSLSTLVRADAGDLSSVTGISRERCAAILERVGSYHRQRAEQPTAAEPATGRARVTELLEALRRCEEEFRDAEAAEDRSRKRDLRRERSRLAKQVELELTDLGDLDLVADLQRESTERKIARIDRWLREPVAPAARAGRRDPVVRAESTQ